MIPAIYYNDVVFMSLEQFIQTHDLDFSATNFNL